MGTGALLGSAWSRILCLVRAPLVCAPGWPATCDSARWHSQRCPLGQRRYAWPSMTAVFSLLRVAASGKGTLYTVLAKNGIIGSNQPRALHGLGRLTRSSRPVSDACPGLSVVYPEQFRCSSCWLPVNCYMYPALSGHLCSGGQRRNQPIRGVRSTGAMRSS